MKLLYFAKWLPVEGEIKEGDMYLFGNKVFKAGNDKRYGRGLKKMKLFLCSRDIKLYDEVYNPVTDEYETVVKDLYEGGGKRPDKCTDFQEVEQCKSFKVIGQISEEATWVKEGDEFDEYRDVWYFELNGKWKYLARNSVDWMRERGEEIKLVCKVKGPCGHFH